MADQLPKVQGMHASARDYLHGAVGIERLRGGWFQPLRFQPQQMRFLGSVAALHPGQFRGMAACASGITLEFVTDASTVSIGARLMSAPQGTRFVMGEVAKADAGLPDLFEDFSVEVDGKAQPYRQYPDGSLYMDVEANAGRLPGFGDPHTFRVWLPALTGVELSEIVCDGSLIEPVPARRTLLVLGDSIAQGYAASAPANTWAARLAKAFDADLVNQGIGAQVFQPFTVPRLSESPFAVVVAYGENYRYENLSFSRIESDIRAYLAELASVFEDVPVFIVSPLWHNEQANPSSNLESLAFVQLLLEELSAEHGFCFVDGSHLIDADPALFADGYEHPADAGMAIVADRLALVMNGWLTDESERRERALELLAKAPMTAFPLAEQIRRGIGEVRVADDRSIFLYDGPYNQTLYANDRHAARDVLSMFVDPATLCMLGRVGLRDAQYILGMHRLTPCYLAVYEKSEPPALDPKLDIRVLDGSFADAIREHYTGVAHLGGGALEALLDEGKMLGAFEKDELVGFIGEHPEGAFGLLEVVPEYRRRKWASALLAAKIAQHLARGFVPWSEIWADNAASLKLHEELGFTLYPSEGMTFMNTPAYDQA